MLLDTHGLLGRALTFNGWPCVGFPIEVPLIAEKALSSFSYDLENFLSGGQGLTRSPFKKAGCNRLSLFQHLN